MSHWKNRLATTGLIAGLATAPGCGETPPNARDGNNANPITAHMQQNQQNIFTVLSEFDLVGVDGAKVNMHALATSLKDKHVTLSFGFNGCSSYCPQINSVIWHLGDEVGDKMASIVINIAPEVERIDQKARDGFQKIYQDLGAKQRVITLNPSSGAEAIQIQKALGMMVNERERFQHSPVMHLAAPGGALVSRKVATVPAQEFQPWINAITLSPDKAR